MKQNKDRLDWHGTTIVLIRKGNDVVVAGDGQVSIGNTVMKSTAKKVRKIEKRDVIAIVILFERWYRRCKSAGLILLEF